MVTALRRATSEVAQVLPSGYRLGRGIIILYTSFYSPRFPYVTKPPLPYLETTKPWVIYVVNAERVVPRRVLLDPPSHPGARALGGAVVAEWGSASPQSLNVTG